MKVESAAHALKKAVTAVLLGTVSFFQFVPMASAAIPNDPSYFQEWYIDAVHLPEAWDFAKGSPTVTVAVLDSGVDLTHPDLHDRIWTNSGEVAGNGIDDDRNGFIDDVHGWDFVDADADPNPEVSVGNQLEGTNHGTLAAGIIGAAGNNSEGVVGAAWNVAIMPLRVLDSQGNGGTMQVVQAVRYAVAKGVKIINISFTGNGYSEVLAEALRKAHDAGILIVASAGNEGDTERGGNLNDFPAYPVCYRGAHDERIVLGVASLDRRGVKSSFSSYGSYCIGISAPGESFYTTQVFRPAIKGFDEPYGEGWFGSSLSAPVVSGVAALIASIDPTMKADMMMAFLTANARNIDAVNGIYAGYIGVGELDAAATVRAVQRYALGLDPAPTVTTPRPVSSSLVKLASSSAVYFLAADAKRYVFPNEKIYLSWFSGFAPIRTITASEMAAIPLGGNVTYRPGIRLVKIQTDPSIYAVSKGGVLRHVTSQSLAISLYGPDWNKKIDDIPEAFFVNYRLGSEITSFFDYDSVAERERSITIDRDKNLLPTFN
jgi:subtilisin family serine protease